MTDDKRFRKDQKDVVDTSKINKMLDDTSNVITEVIKEVYTQRTDDERCREMDSLESGRHQQYLIIIIIVDIYIPPAHRLKVRITRIAPQCSQENMDIGMCFNNFIFTKQFHDIIYLSLFPSLSLLSYRQSSTALI